MDEATIITAEAALAWRLYNRSPGLTQTQIAQQIGRDQSAVCRLLKATDKIVEQLRRLIADAGGDPDHVEQFLARVEADHPSVKRAGL